MGQRPHLWLVKKAHDMRDPSPIRHPHQESPFNSIPPVVIVLGLAIFGIELVFQAGARGFAGGPGGVGWRLEAVRQFHEKDAPTA